MIHPTVKDIFHYCFKCKAHVKVITEKNKEEINVQCTECSSDLINHTNNDEDFDVTCGECAYLLTLVRDNDTMFYTCVNCMEKR